MVGSRPTSLKKQILELIVLALFTAFMYFCVRMAARDLQVVHADSPAMWYSAGAGTRLEYIDLDNGVRCYREPGYGAISCIQRPGGGF
jgi:hypothetical protein